MRISRNIKGLLVIIMGMAITGCTVVVRHPQPPALGYHSQYDYYDDYYYYPSARVYFHIYTGYYYYRAGNRWVRSRVLPRYIRLHSRDRHRLRIKDRHPYLRDYEYQKKYRPRRNFRFNERDSILERNLNKRRFEEYRQRGDRRPEGRPDDRYRNNRERDRREDSRDPRRELYRQDNRSNQGSRPLLRERGPRDERARDQDRRRTEKRTHEDKRKHDKKSKKQSDSEDQKDDRKSNDNRKKDPRSTLFR
jgi:hypothetical protein